VQGDNATWRFARVMATLRRRSSDRKPTSRRGFDRTRHRMIASFSRPCAAPRVRQTGHTDWNNKPVKRPGRAAARLEAVDGPDLERRVGLLEVGAQQRDLRVVRREQPDLLHLETESW
jgi:hypothetical protein